MPGHPATTTPRRLAHTRQIVCTEYIRDDGLYDIEARMMDTKASDSSLLCKQLPAGEPLHDMRVTITVDAGLVIRSAQAHIEAAPTPYCARINETYGKLVGIRISGGFMKEVKARVGGVNGCTHLTELLGPMATTAFQTLMGLGNHVHSAAAGTAEPVLPMLNTCHTWRADGEVVQIVKRRAATYACKEVMREAGETGISESDNA